MVVLSDGFYIFLNWVFLEKNAELYSAMGINTSVSFVIILCGVCVYLFNLCIKQYFLTQHRTFQFVMRIVSSFFSLAVVR